MSGPSILIIDDEMQIREMLKQMLESEGYTTYLARNGEEGLRIAKRKNVNLLITDIVMPKKEGVETIVDFKEEFPHIKIIAISGGYIIGPKRYLDLAESFGADRIFEKPVDNNELLSAIEDLLGESGSMQGNS